MNISEFFKRDVFDHNVRIFDKLELKFRSQRGENLAPDEVLPMLYFYQECLDQDHALTEHRKELGEVLEKYGAMPVEKLESKYGAKQGEGLGTALCRALLHLGFKQGGPNVEPVTIRFYRNFWRPWITVGRDLPISRHGVRGGRFKTYSNSSKWSR